MVRPNGSPAGKKRGTGVMPVLVGMGFFAMVLGALYAVASRDAGQPATVAATTPAIEASPVATAVAEAPAAVPVQTAEPAPVAAVPQAAVPQSRRERVEAQVAAGEYGPAIVTALEAPLPQEQSDLLAVIAQAQIKAGDLEAAAATIRRIPLGDVRRQMAGAHATEQALAGGSMANFQPLIDLIQQETAGPWEAIDGTGGTISQFDTGVRVDPNGLLFHVTKEEQQGRLKAMGVKARIADLNEDMARPSELRLVSLTRLEREIARRVGAGEPVLETMKHLAGLSQIKYVFLYPDEGEVVIGGPAEGWRIHETGLVVGAESGKPTLQLDDFVTVLRTFQHGGLGMFQCLIVPRQEGLKAIKDYADASSARGPISKGATKNWVAQLQNKLGLQDVEVNGVPHDSRVARVIVEADYRMKLIGVGKLAGGEDIPSYFDLLNSAQQKNPPELNALRWWLTMKYDAILHSPAHDVFEVQGSSVWCRSENELINSDGSRTHTGKADPTNSLFAERFTQGYAQLAERDLVFADLQNIFDLSLVAALLSKEQAEGRLDWNAGAFAKNGDYRPVKYEPATAVMSVANHRVYNGKDIVVQVAGGVRGDLMAVVENDSIVKPAERLANFRDQGRAPQLPEGRWWWDAAK